jgi:hypothetical protein
MLPSSWLAIEPTWRDVDATHDWILPVEGEPGVFRTNGTGVPEDFILRPYYSIHKQRYQLYLRQADYRPIPQPWDYE